MRMTAGDILYFNITEILRNTYISLVELEKGKKNLKSFLKPSRFSFKTVPRSDFSSNIVASLPRLVFILIHIDRTNLSKGGI